MIHYQKLIDQELTALLSKGDPYAYTEIFERYKQLLIKHAFQITQNKDEAGDIVQDVFLNLWQKKDELQIQRSLSAYLYKAVQNRVFDLIARKQVAEKYQKSIASFIEEGQCITDEQLREKELAALITKEIDALPKKMREIFLLSRQEEKSYKEIAEQLQISDQTVKLQIHNAVKRLKTRISSLLQILIF